MTRTFDHSSVKLPVPVKVLAELAQRATQTKVDWILIGAAARDLVVHVPLGHKPGRATHDVDIAIAVPSHAPFHEFVAAFQPARGGEHKVIVEGVEVDIVPFGSIETSGKVKFSDSHELDVVGLAEAAQSPDWVTVASGLTIAVASLEAQSALKLLAWRDRRLRDSKDAADLLQILRASSEGLYEKEAWGDDEAMAATEAAIQLAGPWRTGRSAGASFQGERADAVRAVIEASDRRDLLVHDMGGHTGVAELVNSFWSGLHAGLPAG